MSFRTRRIEIVGIAGAGKTTLTRALAERYPSCQVADSLHSRHPAHWPYLVHSLPGLLPMLIRTVRHRPLLSWDELKFVIYVSEWGRFLAARPEYRSVVSVLDQGPIFALARLLWGKKPVTRSQWFQAWLNETVRKWSGELDAIVLLTAPDDVLLERINLRDSSHEAKDRSTRDALELIESHRNAYARVLDVVDRLDRPRVIRFDSSSTSSTEIVEQLADLFEANSPLTVDGSAADLHSETGEAATRECA